MQQTNSLPLQCMLYLENAQVPKPDLSLPNGCLVKQVKTPWQGYKQSYTSNM